MIEEEEINKILRGPQWKGEGKPPENVDKFTGPTKLDVPVDKVLDGAKAADLTEVLIIGFTKEGKPYGACSHNDAGLMLLRIEQTKQNILRWVE